MPKQKVLAIVFTCIATVGYMALFVSWLSWLKYFLLGVLGIFAYVLFTSMYVFSGIIWKRGSVKIERSKSFVVAVILGLVSILALFHMSFSGGVNLVSYGSYLKDIYNAQYSVGGVILGLVVYPLQKYLNVGAYVIWIILLIVSVVLIYNNFSKDVNTKLDWSLFKKSNKAETTAIDGTDQSAKAQDQNAQSIQNIQPSQQKIGNMQTKQSQSANVFAGQNNVSNSFATYQTQSVGLGAEQNQERAREIARHKLGLDRTPFEVQNQQSTETTSQMDIFKKNYMNAGGTVFAKRSSFQNNSEQYAGTFGYSSITSNRHTQNGTNSKYEEYRKFMGYNLMPQTEQSQSQENKHINDSSILSNDEKIFGKPQVAEVESVPVESTEIKFSYQSPDATPKETTSENAFLDKLTSDHNAEVKFDNVQTDVDENHTEDNLKAIFDSNIPSAPVDLPRTFQNDSFVSKQSYMSAGASKKSDGSDDVQRTKIKPYHYKKPPLDLLTTVSTDPSKYGGNTQETAQKIVDVLASFKIPASVIGVTRGPAVTRYEFELPAGSGISVNRIPTYQNDIQMAIATSKNIMIQAPIPGMNAFGVEVPNDVVSTVSLKEILENKEFKEHKSPCAFGLGKEIDGKIDVCAVNKMPHVLIAGSTGSGKSVCLNCLILSILYKSSPEDVKFLLIDPKRVEFSIYQNMPHLVMPEIISDAQKADKALGWAIKEMEDRYRVLEKYRIRNIEEYNNLTEVKEKMLPKMPYIIIIMDEFADIIGECKDIEDKVARLAAKARAAGMHLVLATQRPSVDVLSGTAKNNFPARIAFALSSQQDSRTILNFAGAEDLLGRGDMLYLAPGSNSGPKRIQGCYVSDEEVKAVVDYVIDNNEPDFDESIEEIVNKRDDTSSVIGVGVPVIGESIESDEEMMGYAKILLKEFIKAGRASSSYIQRLCRVGFAKAARILDWLARKKYVSEGDGSSKARSVYITKEQYIQLFGDTDFGDDQG